MVSLLAPEDPLSLHLVHSLSLEEVALAPLSGLSQDVTLPHGPSQSTVFRNPEVDDGTDATSESSYHGNHLWKQGVATTRTTDGVATTTDGVTTATHVSAHSINIAGMYVTDALNFRNVPFRSDKLTLYQIYQDTVTRHIFVLFPILLLGLALIEEPAVSIFNVHWQAALSLELICLVACICRVLHLRACVRAKSFWSDLKNWMILLSITVTLVDVIVWLTFKIREDKSVIRVTRVLRPMLIVNFSQNRNLRKLLRNIKRTVLDVFSVLVLIFLFIAIFAMMATKFFERRMLIDPQEDPYLDNFFDSYWNLYILMTTANSPDVSLPAFRDESAFFFFFAPFSVITTFILMNILLAVVYKHYRLHLIEEVKVDIGIIQDNLESAFYLLRDPLTNHITKEVWNRSYKKLGCKDELQKLYWEYMVPDEDMIGISFQAFFKITDLLSSKIEIVLCRKTWLETTLPRLYNSAISCYIRYAVHHIFFTVFYDILIFANAVVLAVKNAPAFLEDTFLVLFNIEIILKLFTYGPRKFSTSKWNNYDCLVIWTATIFTLVVDAEGLHDSKNEEMSMVFLDMVLTLRVLRLLKLLTSIPQLRLIVNTLMQIVPSMGSYALLLFLFYYSYAIVGMEMFAGRILNETDNCGNDLLNGTEFVAEGYCILTFNNILYSFVVLWTLTLVNQWHILAGGFVAVTNKAARLYFFSFHVIIVLIILNIFLAFVIEAFMLQMELDKDKREGIDQHLDERGESARRDTHRLSEPLWYRKPSLQHSIGEEDEDPNKIYIGTSPLSKIRYKRHMSAKSYNQMLLEMFQSDITSDEPATTDEDISRQNSTSTSTSVERQVSSRQDSASTSTSLERQVSSKRRLTSLQEADSVEEEDEARQYADDFSMGSFENLDII